MSTVEITAQQSSASRVYFKGWLYKTAIFADVALKIAAITQV